jgi:hypothetical protein
MTVVETLLGLFKQPLCYAYPATKLGNLRGKFLPALDSFALP